MDVPDPTTLVDKRDNTPENCTRYFVGGLHRQITPQDVEMYFSQFGDVETFILKRDPNGNSRGFGWVVFSKPTPDVDSQKPHFLKGVKLTVEPALVHVKSDRFRRNTDFPTTSGRRRERSPSDASSASSSDSSSSPGDHRGGRLPPFPSLAPHLPPLRLDAFTPTPHAPMFSYDTAAPSHGREGPASSVNGTYLCIPLSLCPVEFLNDPRTFCAKLDQSRVGGLSIVTTPTYAHAGPVPQPAHDSSTGLSSAVGGPRHPRAPPMQPGSRSTRNNSAPHTVNPTGPRTAPPEYDCILRHNQ